MSRTEESCIGRESNPVYINQTDLGFVATGAMDNSWCLWSSKYQPFYKPAECEAYPAANDKASANGYRLRRPLMEFRFKDIGGEILDLDEEPGLEISARVATATTVTGTNLASDLAVPVLDPQPESSTTIVATVLNNRAEQAPQPISTVTKLLNFRSAVIRGAPPPAMPRPAPVPRHVQTLVAPASRPSFATMASLPATIQNPPRVTTVPAGSLKPWGIAVHPFTRDIFVTDRDVPEVRRYAFRSGYFILLQRFGELGTAPHCLLRPTGIAVDAANGRLLIADKDNHRISIFRLDGIFLSAFGKEGYGNGELSRPWGVAVSPNGNYIAVADSRNHRIQLFDADGGFLRKYSVYEGNPFEYKYHFDYPRGITFDRTGTRIYVTDFNIRNIFVFDLSLTEKQPLVPIGSLKRPQGLTVNAAGDIVICDTREDCVRIISPVGDLIKTIRYVGNDALCQPIDVSVYGENMICVLEASGRIRIFI